jgi:hypothetical protein
MDRVSRTRPVIEVDQKQDPKGFRFNQHGGSKPLGSVTGHVNFW